MTAFFGFRNHITKLYLDICSNSMARNSDTVCDRLCLRANSEYQHGLKSSQTRKTKPTTTRRSSESENIPRCTCNLYMYIYIYICTYKIDKIQSGYLQPNGSRELLLLHVHGSLQLWLTVQWVQVTRYITWSAHGLTTLSLIKFPTDNRVLLPPYKIMSLHWRLWKAIEKADNGICLKKCFGV